MKIDICNLQDKIRIDRNFIQNSAKKILRILKEEGVELSLCFIDDVGIQQLNNRYRHVNRPTDVLAFPMRKGEGLPKGTNILGDVVISIQTAKNEARKRKRDIREELLLYLVHGVLHLVGYSDHTLKTRLKMSRKQDQIIRKLAE